MRLFAGFLWECQTTVCGCRSLFHEAWQRDRLIFQRQLPHFLIFQAPMHTIILSLYPKNYDFCEGYRSDNFVIGLTDVSPDVTPPTLWNYAVCGQYPGAVPNGATVTLQCTSDMPDYRYVIVHFPNSHDNYGNFCELEVYIRRKFLYGIS